MLIKSEGFIGSVLDLSSIWSIIDIEYAVKIKNNLKINEFEKHDLNYFPRLIKLE